MNEIILHKHKEESLLRFHPWVFSGAIRKIVLDKDYPYNKDIVLSITYFQSSTLGVMLKLTGSSESIK